ncbi:hypothetical protein PFICI_13286 [Pestalotiopsis fici W106-1]|uniref:Ribosome recycling factor domain-containing protein n=1 Tax=Pestalotiopsis fici (strain W106-1 / CGMCC3.15140) TaxID=1229662 RepID=W3WNV6_PESFW|nr:uncharacterized protein PFICI_13286 [Pestalotiopsis fici W106-1]ETS74802.1 hypothetical protein PFICI_13286 [Pestalotiopsis fici W106-1]
MRGTTTATLWRQGRALCELRGITQNAVRPTSAALRAAASSSSQSFAVAAPLRPFHTTPCRLKKGGKGKHAEERQSGKGSKSKSNDGSSAAAPASTPSSSSGGSSQHPTPNPEEPLDFADVQSRLAKASEAPAEALKKLKSGGRFNPDLIGSLRVQPDKKEAATYPLRELAQVVPKGGRTISLLVHEEASIKPIMSAIQASRDFNQQPQRDPDNELELVLKMELESREDVARRAKAVCHEWREKVRQVRQKRDKVHAAWKKDGLLLPDAKRKADTELDKVIKAKVAEIDAAEKEALKAAEGK